MKNSHILKSLIFLGVLVVLFLLFCGLGIVYIMNIFQSEIKDEYIQYTGSPRGKELLIDTMDDSKAWLFFFNTMYPESGKNEKPVVDCKINDQRFVNVLAQGGDYLPGEIAISLVLKDLTNNKLITKSRVEEMLPPVVFTGTKKDAQKAAYSVAENKAYKRVRKAVEGAVFLFMANHPEHRKQFMPIMADYFGGNVANTQYKAGLGLLAFGNDAIPFIVEATMKHPERDIICAKIISSLKGISQTNLPLLESLLKHPKETVQAAAISVIGQFIPEHKKALEIVLNAARQSPRKVKIKAIMALGKHASQSKQALDALKKLILDNDQVVRRHASEALASMGKDAQVIMIDMLVDPKLHKQLADDIIRKSGNDKKGLFELLLAKKSENPELVKGIDLVFKTWRSRSGKSYINALQTALKCDFPNTQQEAFKQLLATNQNRYRYRRNRPNRDVEAAMITAMNCSNPEISNAAMQEILNDRFSSKAKRKVYAIKALTAPKEERYKYIRKISSRDINPNDVNDYLKQLPDVDDRHALFIIDLLTSNKELKRVAVPGLINLLPQTSFRARNRIIRMLAADPFYRQQYLPLIVRESWDPKTKAQVNLRSILYRAEPPDTAHMQKLRKLLKQSDIPAQTTGNIIWLFCKLKDKSESEIPLLLNMLKSGKASGLEYYFIPFFKLHGEKGIEGLAYCMTAKSAHTRSQAYRALKKFGAKAVPILKTIKTDNSKAQRNINALIKAADN